MCGAPVTNHFDEEGFDGSRSLEENDDEADDENY
jgi:hypothetical protein